LTIGGLIAARLWFKLRFGGVLAAMDRGRFVVSDAVWEKIVLLLPGKASVYRTRMSGQWVALCGAPEGLLLPDAAHVGWAAMAVLLDQPFGVVAGDEGPDGVAHLLDGLEDATMDDLFFQGAE